ncbi:unnamed protein product, partial [Rotaria magnacalcarata]
MLGWAQAANEDQLIQGMARTNEYIG